MKKIALIGLLSILSITAFAQKRIDYTEKNLSDDKEKTTVIKATTPEGDTAFVEVNRRKFSKENLSLSSVRMVAYSIDELSENISYWKEKGYIVKEMYEDNEAILYLLGRTKNKNYY